jgi:hypothetical protein
VLRWCHKTRAPLRQSSATCRRLSASSQDDATDYSGYMRELAACYPDFALRSYRPLQQGWDSVTPLVENVP